MSGLRWASCSKDMSWSAAQYRHVVPRGNLTTLCGATASHADIWRGNTTKPECPACHDKCSPEAIRELQARSQQADRIGPDQERADLFERGERD